jgi:pilus assembly protein CpaF
VMRIALTTNSVASLFLIELTVHLDRIKDGSRKVVKVSEVQGMESARIVMQYLFMFQFYGFENGSFKGEFKPTGLRPQAMRKRISSNIELPESIFEK